MSRLENDEARIRFLRTDLAGDPGVLEPLLGLLSAEERARHGRLRRPRDWQEFLLAHALVRTSLSACAEVEPRDWVFARSPHGRPEIAGPAGVAPLRFNLSHAHGLVACAVTLRRDVGIDVEHTARRVRSTEIADRFFSAEETAALHALGPAAERVRFFEYWTLKEAYLKARGIGFAVPLRAFAFDVAPDRIRVTFGTAIADDPAAWQFALFRPTPDHVLAIALRREADLDCHLRLEEAEATAGTTPR